MGFLSSPLRPRVHCVWTKDINSCSNWGVMASLCIANPWRMSVLPSRRENVVPAGGVVVVVVAAADDEDDAPSTDFLFRFGMVGYNNMVGYRVSI